MTSTRNDIEVQQLIGGMVDSTDGATLPVVDPATATRIGSVPRGSVEDVDRAVALGAEAFPIWSGASPHERAALLHRVFAGEKVRIDSLTSSGFSCTFP